jgi:type 1 fimbria pilin
MKVYGAVMLFLAGVGASTLTQAADNMNFHGTLIAPPPCTINNGIKIDVDFGERIGVNKVDGINYRQTVDYPIRCEDGAGKWDMTLTLTGTPTGFDDAAVQTQEKADLGIRLYQNGQPFILNQALPVDPNNLPVLEAVPVKAPGSTLTEGAFEATATLQAVYQ